MRRYTGAHTREARGGGKFYEDVGGGGKAGVYTVYIPHIQLILPVLSF